MMWLLLSGLYFASLAQCFPQANLSVSADVECMHVMMTCSVQKVESLSWFQDEMAPQDQTYAYENGDTFPIILYNSSGIQIVIVDAIPETMGSDTFDAISTLRATTSSLKMWNVGSIRCGTNAARSQTIKLTATNVLLQYTPREVSVRLSYNHEGELSEVRVQWSEQVPEDVMCDFIQFYYAITLEDSEGVDVDKGIVTLESCRDNVCFTTFSNFSTSLNYRISGTTYTLRGSAATLLKPEFDFDSCFVTATCNSSETSGNCRIKYSLSPSLEDSSETIETSLNSSIVLPLLEPSVTYYFEAIVTINSSYNFQRLGSFSTGQFDARLTVTNEVVLAFGVSTFTLAIMLTVVLFILEGYTKRGSWLSLILLIVGAVLLVVCVALWIAISAVVIPQINTCDSKWQSHRDFLIISALIFSLLTFLDLVTAAILFGCANNSLKASSFLKIIQSRTKANNASSETILQKTLKQLELDQLNPEDLQARGCGGRFEARESPAIIVDEFKGLCDSKSDLMHKLEDDHVKLEAAIEATKVYSQLNNRDAGECDHKQYSALKHGAKEKSPNQKLKSPQSETKGEYSSLKHQNQTVQSHSNKKESENREYSTLCTDSEKEYTLHHNPSYVVTSLACGKSEEFKMQHSTKNYLNQPACYLEEGTQGQVYSSLKHKAKKESLNQKSKSPFSIKGQCSSNEHENQASIHRDSEKEAYSVLKSGSKVKEEYSILQSALRADRQNFVAEKHRARKNQKEEYSTITKTADQDAARSLTETERVDDFRNVAVEREKAGGKRRKREGRRTESVGGSEQNRQQDEHREHRHSFVSCC